MSTARNIGASLALHDLPGDDPLERARQAGRVLVMAGCRASCVVQLADGAPDPLVRGGAGDVASLAAVAVPLAEGLVDSGRALRVVDAGSRSPGGARLRFAAVSCGQRAGVATVVVLSGDGLSTHQLETVAMLLSAPPGQPEPPVGIQRPCSLLARDLAGEGAADLVSIALFARAGMQLDLHVRSGDLLRRRRVPVGSIWGEAARHGAAYRIGELRQHRGTEHLAALGMEEAVLVSLENDAGVPVGTIGLAARERLPDGLATGLLERTRTLAREVMESHAHTPAQRAHPGAVSQDIELRVLARSVGCRRFAVYMPQGSELVLLGSFAADGQSLAAPPDPFEQELVRTALERTVSITTEGAAVVLLANGVLLYASDSRRDPMQAIQSALRDLVDGPLDGRRRAA